MWSQIFGPNCLDNLNENTLYILPPTLLSIYTIYTCVGKFFFFFFVIIDVQVQSGVLLQAFLRYSHSGMQTRNPF